ncbi:MAG: carotenoid biosynthesis protein [Candidatus Aenigmarchaeota archaeon]|nr:carotenoid biosynthesis protein [Candidatus Aenigmarchaeota archaeon]
MEESPALKKVFWAIFCVFIAVFTVETFNKVYHVGPSPEIITDWTKSVMVFSLCSIYLFWSIGSKKAVVFLVITLSMSFLLELIGITTGYPLGVTYSYDESFSPATLFGLPVTVPINWAIINILGYSIVTHMLTLSGRNKPNADSRKISLLLLIVLDGLVVTAMDVVLDPLKVAQGSWTWAEGGPFYGIPIGNYVGWFVISSVSIGLFRFIEYKRPREEHILRGTMSVMPSVMYMFIAGYLCISAFDIGMYDLALIGLLATFPAPILNIIFHLRGTGEAHGKR